jgi:hypothetical protein
VCLERTAVMRVVFRWHKGALLLCPLVRPPGAGEGRTYSHRSGPAQDAATAITKTSDSSFKQST